MDITTADAKRLFLIDKEDAGVRATSRAYYSYAIDRFISEAAPELVADLSTTHLRTWSAAMRTRGLKPGAIHSYQSAVWTFVRWLYIQDDFGVPDITRKVQMIRVRPEEIKRRTASPGTKKKLLLVAKARPEHPRRNAALIEMLWATGTRRSELAACELRDYDDKAGTLRLRHTKTGVPRLIAVERSGRGALDSYIIRERGRAPGALFLGRGDAPLSSDGMQSAIRSLALGAGIEVSAHDFRRAAAARWLKAGAPLDVAMEQLGHSDPSMTLIYGAEGRQERSAGIIHELDAGVRPIWRRKSS
jgi:integrase